MCGVFPKSLDTVTVIKVVASKLWVVFTESLNTVIKVVAEVEVKLVSNM